MVNKSRSGSNEDELSELQSQALARLKFADTIPLFGTEYDQIIRDALKTKVVSGRGGSLYRTKPGRTFAYSSPDESSYQPSSLGDQPEEPERHDDETPAAPKLPETPKQPLLIVPIVAISRLSAGSFATFDGIPINCEADQFEIESYAKVINFNISPIDTLGLESYSVLVPICTVFADSSLRLSCESALVPISKVDADSSILLEGAGVPVPVIGISAKSRIRLRTVVALKRIRHIIATSSLDAATTAIVQDIQVVDAASELSLDSTAEFLQTCKVLAWTRMTASTLPPEFLKTCTINAASNLFARTTSPVFGITWMVTPTSGAVVESFAELSMAPTIIATSELSATSEAALLLDMERIVATSAVAAATLCSLSTPLISLPAGTGFGVATSVGLTTFTPVIQIVAVSNMFTRTGSRRKFVRSPEYVAMDSSLGVDSFASIRITLHRLSAVSSLFTSARNPTLVRFAPIMRIPAVSSLEAGSYAVKTLFKPVETIDAASELEASSVVTLDVTGVGGGPVVLFSIVTPPFSTTGLSTREVALDIIATDINGIKDFFINETGILPVTPSWTAVKPVTYTFSTDGGKTLYLWVRDTFDNMTLESDTVFIDATPPNVNITGVTNENNNRTVNSIVTSTVSESGSGIKDYWLGQDPSETGGPNPPTSGWVLSRPTIVDPATLTAGDGYKTITLFARDEYGNVGDDSSIIDIDTAAPTVLAFTIDPPPVTTTEMVSTGVCDVHIWAEDNGTLIVGYYFSKSNSTPSSGQYTAVTATASLAVNTSVTFVPGDSGNLYLWVKDASGNVRGPSGAFVTLDFTVPAVSNPTLDLAYCNRSQTLVISAFTATDSGVGLHSSPYNLTVDSGTKPTTGWSAFKPTSFSSSGFSTTNGTHYLYLWVRDAYGNTAVKAMSIIVDTVAPVVNTWGINGGAAWKTGNRTVSIDYSATPATDSLSGIYGWYVSDNNTPPVFSQFSPTRPTSFTHSADGAVKYVLLYCADNAGNITYAGYRVCGVDTVAPSNSFFTITGNGKFSNNYCRPNTIGSAVTTITISSWSTSDSTAGVVAWEITRTSTPPTTWTYTSKPSSFDANITTTQGSVIFYAWCKDAAGNVSSYDSDNVFMDNVLPVVTAPSTVTMDFTWDEVDLGTWSVQDPGGTGASGEEYYYVVCADSQPANRTPTSSGWLTSKPSTADNSGQYNYCYFLGMDRAGNISAWKRATVTA